MGAGLAGGPPCLPHNQVLMGAGLAGIPPCLPHSQTLMGAGLDGTTCVIRSIRNFKQFEDTSIPDC